MLFEETLFHVCRSNVALVKRRLYARLNRAEGKHKPEFKMIEPRSESVSSICKNRKPRKVSETKGEYNMENINQTQPKIPMDNVS